MCVTLGPAELSNTIIYAGEAVRDNKRVHVLAYQNKATSQASRGNAMILPLPAKGNLGPANTIDTSKADYFLEDMADAIVQVRLQGMSFDSLSKGAPDSVQVFAVGSYTVVLAKDPREIPEAMRAVPMNQQPRTLPVDIFEAYHTLYPGWPVAVCCWDGTLEAEPLLWWYEPTNPNTLFAPGLDAHDGKPPKTLAIVDIDHTVIFGSTIDSLSPTQGGEVLYRDTLADEIKNLLPLRVAGKIYGKTRMRNGDFTLPLSRLSAARYGEIIPNRVMPPGGPVA